MDGDGARVPVTVCDGDVARREGWGRCVWKRKAGEKKLSVQYIKKKKKKQHAHIYLHLAVWGA